MRTQIGGHDNNGIFEVYHSALAIGKTAIIQNLQQDIKHISMSLFDFIQQNNAIWMTTNSLRQLTTLIIAHISRRRTNQTRYRVFLHVLTHINTNHAAFIIKESLCQSLGQLSFTNTGRAKEDKGTDWTLRSLDTSSGSQNSLADYLDSLILTNYPLMEHILQMEQLLPFTGKHLGNRNTSPTAYYLGNILLTNFFLQKLAVRTLGSNGFLLSLQLLLQFW